MANYVSKDDIKFYADDNSIKYYDRNYLWMYFLIKDKNKEIKGNYYKTRYRKYKPRIGEFSNDNGTCRFCHKIEPKIKFCKTEHIFSESLGNDVFISEKSECDTCNNKFSKYEDHLNILANSYSVIDGISGKHGTKEYKSFNKKSRVKCSNGTIIIVDTLDSKRLTENEKEKTIEYQFDVTSYCPLFAYKALCKMAFSIMKKDEINNFSTLLNSLQDENKFFGFEQIVLTYFPGFDIFDFTIFGLKKKPDAKDKTAPSFQFVLMNSNIMFQIPLFNNEQIKNGVQNELKLLKIPTPFDKTSLSDANTRHIIAKGNGVIAKHIDTLHFKYDSKTEESTDEVDNTARKMISKIKKDQEEIEIKRKEKA